MRKLSVKRGFSLVEVLIVIAVIGILAGATIAILNPAVQIQKANDSKRKSDLVQIQKAFDTFYQDNGKYPDAANNKIKSLDGNIADWGTQWLPYMAQLPKDPSSSKNYVYVKSLTGQAYYLYANLDRGGNDPQACFPSGNPCSSAVTNGVSAACGGNCNYGVSSPNVSP